MDAKQKLKKIMSDPILWIETFVSIVDKERQLVPFKLNPQQKCIMKNMGKFNICLKSRQLGITSVSLAYSLYLTHTRPNVNCMIMSHCMESNDEIFGKLKQMYEDLPACVKRKTTTYNKTTIKFDNGSKIKVVVCGSKDNGRGSTLDFVHFSEVGLMDEQNFNNQYVAIQQALVNSGQMILESTAKGLNHFSELWNRVVNGELMLWKHFFFNWIQDRRMFRNQIKDYTEKFVETNGKPLQEEDLTAEEIGLVELGATYEQLMWRRIKIDDIGENRFHEEFPATPMEAFVSSGSNVFDVKVIQERLSGILKLKTMSVPADAPAIIRKYRDYFKIWKLPVKNKKYYLGVDTGEGLSGNNDFSVISILGEDGYQVAEWRSNKVKPYEFAELVSEIGKYYNNGMLIVEKASAGHTVVDKVRHDFGYINMFKYKAYDQKSGKARRKVGWETNSKSKPLMILNMQEMFETGQCLINSRDLLNEMKMFQSTDDGKLSAPNGQHDDCVMAFAMALQGIKCGYYYSCFGK